MSKSQGLIMWPVPTGISASRNVNQTARSNHYLATAKTILADGTQIIPNNETLSLILQSWDDFGLELVVSSNSYITKD